MDIIEFREYCLSLPSVTESTPFDQTTLVFKVGGKMFTMADMEEFTHVAVKCDPEKAIELRELYLEITPAYHMNKRHWNDISVFGDIPDAKIKEWVKDSYDLVFASLSRNARGALK